MEISVIIPTFNEEEYLPSLLQDLKNQTYQDFEVIVADANSTDSTRKIANTHHTQVVDGGSPARGRNAGARAAQGNWLLFLDADVRIPRHLLERLLRHSQANELDLFSAHSRYVGMPFGSALLKLLRKHRFLNDLVSQSLFIRKRHFDRLGGFDESFDVGEDIDFGRRAGEAGYKYGYVDEEIATSCRRFKKEGAARFVAVACLLLLWQSLAPKHYSSSQNFVIKLYGGWGY